MAKNMARLDNNNIVINIEWMADFVIESDSLKEIYDYLVEIGDTYKDGRFYRNGEMILSNIEETSNIINNLKNEKQELITSYTDGVNSI